MTFPTDAEVDVRPPGADEVEELGHAVLSAVGTGEGPTPLQILLVTAMFEAMTGHTVDVADHRHVGPDELAAALSRRNEAYRMRILQVMVLVALIVRPMPVEVTDRVVAYARALGVDDGMLHVGWTLVIVAFALIAVAASVYLVIVLEILKFKRFRERELRRQVETGEIAALSEDEIGRSIEHEVETGEFQAVRPREDGSQPPETDEFEAVGPRD